MTRISRREFLNLAAGASAISVLAATGGCEWLANIIKHRPVRKCIDSLPPNDPIIQTYKDAIVAMKALPASDPRNWTNQASIHLNHCPHSNWFFLPWHRAYLLYFEQICRHLTGSKDFALPYWNWTENKKIPSVFWGGASNPLFNGTRTATSASTLSDSVVGMTVVDDILNEPNFLVFASGVSSTQRGSSVYGRLEATPHNSVHGFVGGDMGNYMSPLDPVFWTHHNMIERCWVDWNANRHHPNSNDTAWTNFVFQANFCDANGNPVDIQVSTTFLLPLLSYRYDNYALGTCGGAPYTIKDTEALRKLLQEGARVKLEFSSQFELKKRVEVTMGTKLNEVIPVDPNVLKALAAAETKDRTFLILEDVDLPADGDFYARVFINKPDADRGTPLEDPHYAGSFAFFGGEHMSAHGGPRPGYLVDATAAIRRLAKIGAFAQGKLQVQIVLVQMDAERQPKVGKFSLGGLRIGFVRDSVN